MATKQPSFKGSQGRRMRFSLKACITEVRQLFCMLLMTRHCIASLGKRKVGTHQLAAVRPRRRG